tara:strand:+ start:86 stop:271 length:186 start_codon:yes stop_codon:yes gene_type:complete
MVTGFPARILENIDKLIFQDKLDFGDLKLIRDQLDSWIDDIIDEDMQWRDRRPDEKYEDNE